MENTTNLASPTARIEVVDALRGFAVLAILVAVFGVWPDAALSFVEPYVDGLVATFGVI